MPVKNWYYIFFLILVLSCKNESLRDKTLPVITVISPVENQHYLVGDTILIKGTITDLNELEETGVHITSTFNNNEFLHLHYGLLHSNTWNFEVKHKVTHTNATDYRIEIEGIDDQQNVSRKNVLVKIN